MNEQLESDLYYSIVNDDPLKLEKLITSGFDPNFIFSGYDPLGKPLFWTPLHFCCEKGRLECARVLLKHGADPEFGDKWCMTPLMYAVRSEWHELVQLILQEAPKTLHNQDSKGRTALHIAAECWDDECIKLLCEAGADVNAQDLVGRTPVWQTVTRDGRKDHLAQLLKYGCHVNVQDKRDKRIPLQEAIVYSDKDCFSYVTMLMEAHSNCNHRDEANLNSILNLMVKIKRKSLPPSDDEIKTCKLLILSGYEINSKPTRSCWHKYGGTALHMACEIGLPSFVSLFLEAGALVDERDDSGVVSLLSAISNKHIECAIQLLLSNCDPNISGEIKSFLLPPDSIPPNFFISSFPLSNPNTVIISPIECALIMKNYDISLFLLRCGAKISQSRALLLLSSNESNESFNFFLPELLKINSLFDLCVFKIRRSFRQNLFLLSPLLRLPNIIIDYINKIQAS